MILDMKRAVLEIEYRGIACVKAPAGTRIDCLRGCVWITECGARDDIVLRPGEWLVILRGGITVMQGLREGALVGLRAALIDGSESRRTTRLERLWHRWAAREAAC